ASAAADPSGFGEGQRYLGSAAVTTDASGNASFNLTLAAATTAGEVVSATATDAAGNTSEFAQALPISGPVDLSGRVFDDKNNDGVYQPGSGEVAIGGVTVQLINQTTGAVVATRTTASDGTYLFEMELAPGTYKIVE